MDAETIKNNIAARKAAEEFIGSTAIIGISGDPIRFWEVVAQLAAARAGLTLASDKDLQRPAMSDEEAEKFRFRQIQHGKHAGRLVNDVDDDYWILLVESEFQTELARYVRSRYFKRRQQ